MTCQSMSGLVAGGMGGRLQMLAAQVAEEVAARLPKREKGTWEQMRNLADGYLRNAGVFKPGDIIMWKQGMKNADVPEYGEPVAVLEVKPGGRGGQSGDPCSVHFDEPLDIRVGVIMPSGAMQAFWFDSRRFEWYMGDSEPIPTTTSGCGVDAECAPEEKVEPIA